MVSGFGGRRPSPPAMEAFMKAAKILRNKIASGQPTLGALCTFHFWPGLVEVAVRAGLDYLIIDLEHLTHSHEAVAEACATARLIDFPVLIRPPAAEMVPLRLAMDLGPCGLMVPYVEGAADMDTIRDAVWLKPRGKRRPGGPANRWVPEFHYETWKREVEDDFFVMPQIESRRGLDNVDAIAAHPVTTAMAIGPYDLSADLGVCWQPASPVLVDAIERVRAAARKVGKATWMIGDGAALRARGFTFLCIAEPVMLLEGTLKSAAAAARACAAPPSADARPLP